MTDIELEAAIDEVGRHRVFDLMHYYGWNSYDAPPKYVWWQAVFQLRSAHRAIASMIRP